MGKFHEWKGRLHKVGKRYPIQNGPPYRKRTLDGDPTKSGGDFYPSDAKCGIGIQMNYGGPNLIDLEVFGKSLNSPGYDQTFTLSVRGINRADKTVVQRSVAFAIVPADDPTSARTKAIAAIDADARLVAVANSVTDILITPDLATGVPTWDFDGGSIVYGPIT